MYFTQASLFALLGLSAFAMAVPAPAPGHGHGHGGDQGTDVNGDGKPDKILFEVTSESKAVSTVEIPLGGNVVLDETAVAIAATSVIVADVGRAICTITTAEAESSVTDVIRKGWKKIFESTVSAEAEVKTISCDYKKEDKKKYGHRNDKFWKHHSRHGKHHRGGHGKPDYVSWDN